MPKCLLSIKVEHRTFEITLAASQLVPALSAQTRQPTRPQTFNESFHQCHLIPQKVKVASVERAVVVFRREKHLLPPFLKARNQNNLLFTRRGANFRVILHGSALAGVMNGHISKRAIILKQANIPQCGVTRSDFDKEPYPMWYLRKKREHEYTLYRYVFTGKWRKNSNSKYQQWHSQQRSECVSIQFGNEKQRHMVTQMAAFANKCRWHIAPSGKGNLTKAALF